MLDQPDLSTPASVPILSLRLALSDEARASLEAVRQAQEAARQRNRQQTRRTRLWFVTAIAGLAVAAGGAGPRLARWWHGSPAVAATAPAPAPSLPVAAPPAEPTLAAQAAAPAAAAAPDEGCDTTAVRTAPWRLSPEACARAFAAHPTDAALALAVAHAEHARGHLDDAAQWARRALALDPNEAEAYVMIARADVAGGRREAARAAYRRYLELAPRGWHRAEARRATR
jgi:tetratricopeptide (TPR) repeat protein